MKTIDNIIKVGVDERAKLLKILNRVCKTPKADSTPKESMQKMDESNNNTFDNITSLTELLNYAKLPHEFNQRLLKAENYIQNSTRLIEIANSLKAINLPSFHQRITTIESTQVTMETNISSIKGMVTKMFQAFKGMSSSTPSDSAFVLTSTQLEVHASVRGGGNLGSKLAKTSLLHKGGANVNFSKPRTEIIGSSFALVIDITPLEHPESPSVAPKANRGKGITTNDTESPKKLVKAPTVVRPDPNEAIRVPYEIHESQLSLPPAQAPSQLLGRKRKIIELEHEICIPGLECNRSLPEGVQIVDNMVIEEPEYEIFYINIFSDEAFQKMSDIHKVDTKTLLTYQVMDSDITTPEKQKVLPEVKEAY
ncbi:hypothetical protein Tco_1325338 [Tanacetum coccineum]